MSGADGKVIIERLCISLPHAETFISKVIKGFVPELRSRYVFFVCQDSYVTCIYVMNILCTFHISVSWVWYRKWKQWRNDSTVTSTLEPEPHHQTLFSVIYQTVNSLLVICLIIYRFEIASDFTKLAKLTKLLNKNLLDFL